MSLSYSLYHLSVLVCSQRKHLNACRRPLGDCLTQGTSLLSKVARRNEVQIMQIGEATKEVSYIPRMALQTAV